MTKGKKPDLAAVPTASFRENGKSSDDVRSEEMVRLEQQFIEDRAHNKRLGIFKQISFNALGIALFLLLWEVAPRLVPDLNLLMFPPPSGIIDALIHLVTSGELFRHALISLLRSLTGFVIGAVLGIALGILVAEILALRQMLDPVLHGMRSIPVIAMVPLAIIWFGIGEVSKIALITWGAFFPVWVNAYLGARDVHVSFIRSAQSLGASGRYILFTVILPGALPFIISGLRLSLTLSFVVMVAAELVGASQGLGYLITNAQQLFRVDYMFVGLLTLGAIGFILDQIFVVLVGVFMPWYGRSE